MIFDVDTLVEEILSKSNFPDWILSADPQYFSLKDAEKYLQDGGTEAWIFPIFGSVYLLWMDNPLNPSSYFRIIFRTELIETALYGRKDRKEKILTSMQDWQKLSLPEFVKKKA